MLSHILKLTRNRNSLINNSWLPNSMQSRCMSYFKDLKSKLIYQDNSKTYFSKNSLILSNFQDIKWNTVFWFPPQTAIHLISRVKFRVAIFLIALSPVMVDKQHLLECLVFCNIFIALIGVYSVIVTRIVGNIAVSEDKKFVKIGHLDFWGRRVYSVIDYDEVMALSDSGEMQHLQSISKIRKYNAASKFDYFLLFYRFGKVLDEKSLNELFFPCFVFKFFDFILSLFINFDAWGGRFDEFIIRLLKLVFIDPRVARQPDYFPPGIMRTYSG